jgi:K+-sensing histidine kinase KdpD
MKKKKDYRPKSTKAPKKTIPRSIGNKLAALLGCIIPIAALIAYSMDRNFFSITIIISIFILIISIAAYVKGEVVYSHPKVVHNINTPINKNNLVHKKNHTNFSFSLNKGTVQVVFSIMVIIVCAFIGQVIYKL